MPENNKKRDLTPLTESPGLLTGLSQTARLVLRLMADRRINFFLKLLPIGTLVYLVSPLDAVIPVVDDALIIGLGTYVFIELCPPEIVEEHRKAITGQASTATTTKESDSEVVEAIFSEEKKGE